LIVDVLRLRAAALVGFGLFGLSWGAWGVTVPAVLESTGATEAELGIGLVVLAAGAVPAMAVTGRVVDRVGFRVLGLVAPAFAVSWLVVAAAPSVGVLVGGLFMVGVLSGGFDVAVNAAAAEVERSRDRPVLPVAHAFFSFGVVVGALGTGLARQLGGAPALVFAVLGVLAVALNRTLRAGGVPAARRATGPGVRLPWSPLIVIGTLVAVGFLIENAHQTWGARLMESDLAAPPVFGALAPAAFALATGTSRLALQWLTSRLSTTAVVAGGAGITAVATAMVALAPSVPVAVTGFLLAGVGTAVLAPALIGLAGRTGGAGATARAVSVVATIGYAGFLSSPAIVGFTASATSLSTSFLVMAGLAAALSLSSLVVLPALVGRTTASVTARFSR
jgi:hypothetical protein